MSKMNVYAVVLERDGELVVILAQNTFCSEFVLVLVECIFHRFDVEDFVNRYKGV